MGNLIGANQVRLAKRMTIYMLQQVCVIGLLTSIPLYAYRESILRLFSNDDHLDFEPAENSMALVAWINVILAFWCTFCGVYRALGMQA